MLDLFLFPRPVVAACTGHAIAGGTVMLLGAEERYGAKGPFRIGLNETAIGLSLPRFVVEMARAQLPVRSLRAVITQGELFPPEKAVDVGLLDGVLSPDEVVSHALERARLLGALPAKAYRDNKHALREAAAASGRLAYRTEIEAFRAFLAGQSRG